MIDVPLSLRLAPAPLRPPTAWLVPGTDPQIWLARLANFGSAEFDLYIIPSSRQDRSPIGLLAIPIAPTSTIHAEGLIPFGRVQNLFLPVDAFLWPPITSDELKSHLHCDINIFHPAIGIIGFSNHDRIRISSLLAPHPRSNNDWTKARPGIPPPARLMSVMPLFIPGAQDILDQGQDDIAQKPLEETPKLPTESSVNPLVKALVTMPLAAAATMLQKLADAVAKKNPPKPAPPPSNKESKGASSNKKKTTGGLGPAVGNILSNLLAKGAGAIRNLTPKQFAALASALEDRRNREINRLLSLLASDPDEGLRYALPIGGEPGRGLATPSDRLGPRNINFNPSSRAGSRAADPWRLSSDIQQKLRERYRNLASRELQLGRHRRAAYIFAQLLGDLTSAANALKQGRQFREAATLYKERLRNNRAAADCLAEGGLLSEAIPLYEELGLFERAGDLYTQLQQTEEAQKCYRRVVRQLIDSGQHLKAATFLDHRLHLPREAIEVLDMAWPTRPDARECMSEIFRLLGRLADSPEAENRVSKLRAEKTSSTHAARIAGVLADVVASFPDPAIQRKAADATKVVIGRQLESANRDEALQLTRFLPGLSPTDKLLPRDIRRFVQSVKKVAPLLPETHFDPTRRKPVRELKILRTFKLPAAVDWRGFISGERSFFAIGLRKRTEWIAVRSNFRDGSHICSFNDPTLEPLKPLSLLAQRLTGLVYTSSPPTLGIIHLGGAIQIPNGFPQSDDAPPVRVAMPWMPQNPLAVTSDEHQNVWVLHNESSGSLQLALSVFESPDGDFSQPMQSPFPKPPKISPSPSRSSSAPTMFTSHWALKSKSSLTEQNGGPFPSADPSPT